MKTIYHYNSPIGTLKLVCSNEALEELAFCTCKAQNTQNLPQIILTCKEQLDSYFKGELREFDIPIKFSKGTPFQQSVWQELAKIPYGQTKSYKEIATSINNPKAVRAVGGANNKNPISIIIPCHRVIGADGKLVGYGGELWRKEFLLNLEKKALKS
jgi:methylated-DNA-[protein]-cysteine S-methyltransferase